jgi:hypothetical protein
MCNSRSQQPDSFLQLWVCSAWLLPISEIPDCPSIDGSIPAPATDTDGGLGCEENTRTRREHTDTTDKARTLLLLCVDQQRWIGHRLGKFLFHIMEASRNG